MQVVLAANELPSINDVTYPELVEVISKVVTITFWASMILADFLNFIFERLYGDTYRLIV